VLVCVLNCAAAAFPAAAAAGCRTPVSHFSWSKP